MASLRHGDSDPSQPMSPSQSTEDIFRTIMKIRKSWKTLKGNAEPVWPPRLEATMLKGVDHIH
jgi:transcriptional enhancer factor